LKLKELKIQKFIKIKGKEYPVVNTPLSNHDLWFMKDNYDRFVIYDVSKGTYKFGEGLRQQSPYKVDIGFKPIFYTVISFFAIYSFYKTKKKIKEQIKGLNPLNKEVDSTEWDKTINGWGIKEEPKKDKKVQA
jgi:hypothetical protein